MMKAIALCSILLLAFTVLAQQPEPKPGQAAPEKAAAIKPPKDYSNRPPVKPPSGPWQRPKLKLAAEIKLGSDQAGQAEAKRAVMGGEFAPDGWRAKDKLDRFVLELKDGFAADEAGAIELEMSNLDFVSQVDGRKQHFFSFFTDASGDHFRPNQFFTLRGGNYSDAEGNRGIKVLWKGGAERDRGEKAPFAARKVWDKQAVYIWRAEWTRDELVVLLDGERIFGPAEFKEREPRPLKYVFLSRDGCPKEKVFYGFAGPVYRKIRVYRETK